MFTRHVIKQLSAYSNGELSAEESRRVREHLLACQRCRKEHDEIKLGVRLAEQLPMATVPAELWREIEALLDAGSRKPVFEPRAPRLSFAFSWYRVAAFSAVLIAAVAIGLVLVWYSNNGPVPTWAVARLRGDNLHLVSEEKLAVGETLETDGSSHAKVNVGMIGEIELYPNTRIRLVRTRLTEHRIALDRGRIRAKIWAPPRLFFVDTPSAEAIDLGCEYTLEVDDAGRGLLHVTLGEVALVRNGREVYIPRYGMCQSRPGIGPGTPYFEDASEAFVSALEKFDFESGGEEAFNAVLKESRPRDTFTLWSLLSNVEGDRRVRVLDRMIELVGLPKGITREGILQLDQSMLDEWKDDLDTVWF